MTVQSIAREIENGNTVSIKLLCLRDHLTKSKAQNLLETVVPMLKDPNVVFCSISENQISFSTNSKPGIDAESHLICCISNNPDLTAQEILQGTWLFIYVDAFKQELVYRTSFKYQKIEDVPPELTTNVKVEKQKKSSKIGSQKKLDGFIQGTKTSRASPKSKIKKKKSGTGTKKLNLSAFKTVKQERIPKQKKPKQLVVEESETSESEPEDEYYSSEELSLPEPDEKQEATHIVIGGEEEIEMKPKGEKKKRRSKLVKGQQKLDLSAFTKRYKSEDFFSATKKKASTPKALVGGGFRIDL